MDVQASSTAPGTGGAGQAGSDGGQPLPDYSEWIGRTETLTDVAAPSVALRLGAVLDRPAGPERVCPGGHWLHFAPDAAMSELGPDGHPRLGGFMPPLPFPRRMWAGSRIAYHAPIRVGQSLEKTTTIEAVTPKEGRSGRLCFVELRHDVSADGARALTEHQTIVYKEAVPVDPEGPGPARPPRADGPAPEGWDWAEEKRTNEVMLFRYSALTFNSHRIHYDLPYATQEEGYPGLVVHGPLSATMLMDSFLQRHPDAQVLTFDFSARSPLFVGEQTFMCGRETAPEDGSAEEGVRTQELAVVGPGGAVCVKATLTHR